MLSVRLYGRATAIVCAALVSLCALEVLAQPLAPPPLPPEVQATPQALPSSGIAAQPVSQPTPNGAAPNNAQPGPVPQAMPNPAGTQATPPNEVPLSETPETTVVGQQSNVGAQGGAVSGAQQIETATRTSTPISQVGSSVSVVTSEQIAQRGITSVADALRLLPGVDVVQAGNPGSVTSVFIRGATSEHTKVLLDGIPMNDPITTGRLFDFSALAIDNIERIEIIRGPQSVLYGSDAIGGVINIITVKGKGPWQKRFGAMGGSYGTSRELLSLSGGNSQIYSSWAGSYFDTRGFSSADKRLGNNEKDAFHLGNLSGRMGWTPYSNLDVDFVFRMNRGDVNIDDTGGIGQDDPNQKNFTEQIATRTQIRYQGIEELWEQKLSYSTAHHHRQNIDPTDPLHPLDSFFSRFNGFTQLIDWQHNLLLLDNNTLTFGVSYQQEDGNSRFRGTSFFGPFVGNSPTRQLRDAAFYFQDQINIAEQLYMTIGTRQDHYSQAGTASTYRATVLWRMPTTQTAWRGSIGTGFKAPTIFQLYDAFSGEPNLRPEESRGWDVGVEQPLLDGDVVLGGTYFRNDFYDLIDFNPGNFLFFNVGRAQSHGAEVSTFFRLTETADATLTYTHLDTRDRATDLPLLRRPRDRMALTLNRKFRDNRLNWNVTFAYVGQRFDRDFTQFPAPRVVLSKYILLNSAITYDVTPRMQLFVRGDNLTNEVYQEVFGFGTAAISGYGGATINW